MAAGDLYIECDGGTKKLIASSGWLEKLNALAVKTDGNKYGLRAVRVSAAANTIDPLVGCDDPLKDIGDLLGWIIVESASGAPAIGLIEEA
jgi:hypothetical protein